MISIVSKKRNHLITNIGNIKNIRKMSMIIVHLIFYISGKIGNYYLENIKNIRNLYLRL